ncbi:hypothetical protein [Bradyrhizobium sp. RDM4]|uniref:hypothetical protein n=1 Tax=Bradyrhizobium sp. RDM4 TaxID=3378765 RepID=UPI0038FD2CFF
MSTSPNTNNLSILKGIVFFQKDGDSEFRDLGECPTFDVSNDVTNKDYNTARTGITTVAKTVTTKLASTIDLVLNEITPENIGFFALGAVEEASDGSFSVTSLSETQIEGILKVEGANDVGNRLHWTGRVSLKSNGKLSLLTDGDDWAAIALQATVLKTDLYGMGKFTFPIA